MSLKCKSAFFPFPQNIFFVEIQGGFFSADVAEIKCGLENRHKSIFSFPLQQLRVCRLVNEEKLQNYLWPGSNTKFKGKLSVQFPVKWANRAQAALYLTPY